MPFETINDRPSELNQLSELLVDLKRTVTNSVSFLFLFNGLEEQCMKHHRNICKESQLSSSSVSPG